MNHAQVESKKKNPLLQKLCPIKKKILDLKEKTKTLYFRVLLSQYKCPKCGGELFMTAQSQCSCACGLAVDPTITFQRSTCCSATLSRKTHHYACSKCKKITPSRFLFDERLFNNEYFKKMMREHRARAKKKWEEMVRRVAQSRSDQLILTEAPCLEAIPGLERALDAFVGEPYEPFDHNTFDLSPKYVMENYRRHILESLEYGSRLFSGIGHLGDDSRKDRAFRFVTAVFMRHEREVELVQLKNDLLIERVENETYE